VIEMADHPVDLLLRRGQVGSHGGDVPVTEEGLTHAVRAGTAIAALHDGPMTLLFGGTRRTRQTAEALFEGIGRPDRSADLTTPSRAPEPRRLRRRRPGQHGQQHRQPRRADPEG
jgi:broad specificity phosphatase PhoE